MKRLLFVALAAALLVVGCAEEFGRPDGEVTGYEHVVLAELFTATWCGNCPKAEAALDRLHDEEGPGRLAVIHWHPTQQGDPFGLSVTDERWAAYQAKLDTLNESSFPTCIFGGTDMVIGAATIPYAAYRDSYEHERELGSHLELSLALDIGADDVTLDVRIRADEEATAEELELWVVLVEHRVPRPDIPGFEELYSFVARGVEVETVQIQAGGEQHRQMALAIPEAWDRNRLHVVAFLQPKSLGAVRQAAMAPLSFRAFSLMAADTTFTGEEAPRSFAMAFTIENTGTQRDSLEIDLPTALLDLPEDWTAGLEGLMVHPTPLKLILDPGEVVDSLMVRVTTGGPVGKGEVGVVARSLSDPEIVQALRFHFQYGGYSFTAGGPEQPIAVQPGQVALAPLTLHNTGIEDLAIVVDLPASQPNLPAGWTATLASSEGTPLASPDTVGVAAGEETDDVGVKVTTTGAGIGSVRVLVSSLQTITPPQEITIDVRAGEVAFTIAPQETTVVAPIFEIFPVHYRLAQSGTIPSPIFVDTRSAGMPQGWPVIVCTGSICYGDTHTVEIDELEEGVDIEFTALGEATGTAKILFSSTLDPTVVDTVLINYSTEGGGQGPERVVLAELFTSVFCPNCPEAEAALDSLYREELATGRLAVIHWHTLTSPIPDQFYGLAHADSLHDILDARQPGTQAEPHCVFDGDNGIGGGTAATYALYRARFNEAVAVPSPAQLTVTLDATTARVVVTTEVAMDEGEAYSNVELKIVLLEDDAYKSPAPHGEQDFVARAYHRRTISIEAGQTQSYQTGEIPLDPEWDYRSLFVVAMVREQEFGTVHQSAMLAVPFGARAGR